jgi:hypothetical protein|tara:strand:+ start:38 stop:436 length:399 start_codon:yes stop_codon:yes gene_type:complete
MAVRKNNIVHYAILTTFILIIFVIIMNGRYICESFSSEKKKYSLEYYYMDGCGHCEDFNKSGVWDQLMGKTWDNVSIIKYNMKDKMDRVKKFNITGFPSIILVDVSDGKDKLVSEFKEERTRSKIESFINNI